MKYWLFLLFAAFANTGFAQSWTKDYDFVDGFQCGLALVHKNEKHGFVNPDGKLVVPTIYDDASAFSECMALVKKNGKWGYVDSTGKLAIDLKYSDAYSFSYGYAVVSRDNKYGFVDRNGKEFHLEYDMAKSFAEGLAAVQNSRGLWGYIDTNGKIVIPFKYEYGDAFYEGRAKVMLNEKWVLIDTNGKEVKE